MSAMLVSQNIKRAAMLVFPTNRLGVELFSSVNSFFFVPINLNSC